MEYLFVPLLFLTFLGLCLHNMFYGPSPFDNFPDLHELYSDKKEETPREEK